MLPEWMMGHSWHLRCNRILFTSQYLCCVSIVAACKQVHTGHQGLEESEVLSSRTGCRSLMMHVSSFSCKLNVTTNSV